ncbi:MAG: YicC/YloC family endoribonuclease [Pseudomonadota bacterium]
MPLRSMTGYASVSGATEGLDWVWDARSVNARGLDIRCRIPDGLDTLEQRVRKAVTDAFSRGSVTIGLRVSVSETRGPSSIDRAVLAEFLSTVRALRDAAEEEGMEPEPLTIGDILSNRAIFDTGRSSDSIGAAAAEIAADIPKLLTELAAARASEGRALTEILAAHVHDLGTQLDAARSAAAARGPAVAALLKERVAALLEATDRVDEARLAQELALLAVKVDVSEELDRLDAHVSSARALLDAGDPVGRRLDFLCQEFNREANTLCSKSGSAELTAAGLEMKLLIDRLREQCQNVE